MAAEEYREVINKGYKEVLTGLPDKLKKQLENDEVWLGYSGYIYIPIQIGLKGKNQPILHYAIL